MKNVLIYPDTDPDSMIAEKLREHVVVSYVARYCNHCLRLRPLMDKVSLRFSQHRDGIVFNRFDLDVNDFDFLEFDKVPKIRFYPKGIHALGVDLKVFDKHHDTLTEEAIYK